MDLGILGIEATRRCNYRCKHCYLGDAQQLDLNPDALRPILDYFPYIHQISLYGGETMTSPTAVKIVRDVLRESKAHFGGLSLVTNGSIYNKEILDTLGDIHEMSDKQRDGEGVQITFSNDYYHRLEEKRLGITRAQIWGNYQKMRETHPQFTYEYRKFEPRKELLVFPIGRGKLIASPYLRAPNLDFTLYGNKLECFTINAKGKAIKSNCSTTYFDADTGDNYGDVTTTPLQDIFAKHLEQ